MTLELIDESDIKSGIKKDVKRDIRDQIKIDIKNEEKSEIKKEVRNNTKGGIKGLSLVSKDDVINCERTKLGMANNRALCGVLNTEIFGRYKINIQEFKYG